MLPRNGTAGTCRVSRAARSSDDVGPGSADDLSAVLVLRDGLEHVELPPVLLAEVLEGRLGRDRVAGADRLRPDEFLPAMDHAHEVDADLLVEDRRADRAGGVDDREHRRRHDVAEARVPCSRTIEVDLVGLPHGVRVLADLLAPHLVLVRRELLADGVTHLLPLSPPRSRTARKASCGTSMRPTCFMRFLPSFCFSSSLR